MQQITIIGLGLIGGSIGMALKRWSTANGNALKIIGYDADTERQAIAKSKHAIDTSSWNLGDAIRDADVVIVATPVGAMQQVFEDIADHLKPGAIVTDTGSTKVDVLKWAASLPEHVSFVGGHPMAGKSESLEAATPDLFKDATWIVTPSPMASEDAIKNVLGLIAATDAEAFFADAEEHDAYVAGISHLPFVVAASLVRTATSDNSWRDMRTLASSGFRDSTRLALGSPEMHRDIVVSNKRAVTQWINQMVTELESFRDHLNDDDDETARTWTHQYFTDAQDARARAETTQRRDAEVMSDAEREAHGGSLGQSMGRMLFGGFARKSRDKSPTRR